MATQQSFLWPLLKLVTGVSLWKLNIWIILSISVASTLERVNFLIGTTESGYPGSHLGTYKQGN